MAKENKEYLASYVARYGSIEMGCFIPDSESTTDHHYFEAPNDKEAIEIASSFETKKEIKNGRFSEENPLPKLEQLLEIRRIELPKK